MSDVRSSAAQAGICDEPQLINDLSRELKTAETVTACAYTWLRYVAPVEASINPETLAKLGRVLRIRMAVVSPFE